MISLIRLLNEVEGNPKAIILAGAPGAGKGSILKDLDLSGLKILNLDDTILALSKEEGFSLDQKTADAEDRSAFMKAMAAATKKLKGEQIPQTIANKDSFILDGTAASSKQTKLLVDELEEAGYDVMMLYVYTHLETSLKRNQERFEKSGGKDRSLMPGAVYSQMYKECYGKEADRYGILWLKSKSRGEDKAGKRLKGKNWEMHESSRSQEENIDIFLTVKKLFDLENPKHKPIFTEFRTQAKRKL